MKRLQVICGGVILIVAWATIPATFAAVDVTDSVERYTINGSTPLELRQEMNNKGPRGNDGRRFDGFTRWFVSWRFRYNNAPGGCTIASVTTSVKVTITLPEWRNESGGDSASHEQWSRYLAALERHEQGHRRHGIAAGHEVDQAIASLPPASTCDALGANANALGASILRKYNQLDLDYDRDTRHGATQGVRFP